MCFLHSYITLAHSYEEHTQEPVTDIYITQELLLFGDSPMLTWHWTPVHKMENGSFKQFCVFCARNLNFKRTWFWKDLAQGLEMTLFILAVKQWSESLFLTKTTVTIYQCIPKHNSLVKWSPDHLKYQHQSASVSFFGSTFLVFSGHF